MASGIPTGEEPAFRRDLKNTELSSMVGPPIGTFDFVGSIPPSEAFNDVYGQSVLSLLVSKFTAVVVVVSNSSSHTAAPRARCSEVSATAYAPTPSPASDGAEAMARRRTRVWRDRGGMDTPFTRGRDDAPRADTPTVFGTNKELDADAMAQRRSVLATV
tara:strand:+ start:2013 stop:2492 length:480 start_codon:yes stop_codon:yes gene_type:complete